MSLVRTQVPVLVIEVHVDYSTHGLQTMEDIVLSAGNRWQCCEACNCRFKSYHSPQRRVYANSGERPVEITLLNIWFVGQVWLRHLIVDQEITGSNPVRIALEDFSKSRLRNSSRREVGVSWITRCTLPLSNLPAGK